MAEPEATAIALADLDGAEAQSAWLRPIGLVAGTAAVAAAASGLALPLAGGSVAFTTLELLARRGEGVVAAIASLEQVRHWATALGPELDGQVARHLDALSAPRPDWAGLKLDRPLVMGILNVTPDSFSDGGAYLGPEAAIAQGAALMAAGADIIDIGGESTRPGAQPVSPADEMRRIEPVVRALVQRGAVLSVDTRHAAVMEMGLAAGARIVNDVTALTGDAASLGVIARAAAPVILMHMQGEPQTMQHDPRYRLASLDVLEALAARVAACEAAGIPRARIVIDPGIGFGKAQRHNLEILARLSLFHALGTGVLIGVSRKSLVGRLAGAAVGERLPGSIAGALHALSQGVQIIRVHDVAETRQAVALWRAIGEAC